MSDKDLLVVQAKEQQVKKLENELAQAKEAYNQAIRQMHIDGKSLREIARLLNISHQRVHQIIESDNKGWRAWLRPANPELACSFCGLAAARVKKLVQGPNIFACDFCITSCSMVLSAKCSGHSILSNGVEFKRLDAAAKLRCSFCGKLPSHKRSVIAGDKHQICDKCIELSLQYMQIDKPEEPKAVDHAPSEPLKKYAVVVLHLYIQRNSKWVRGIKKSIEDIEMFVLPHYRPKQLSDREYELQISYEDDKDLDDQMNDLLTECHRMADTRNCFSESRIEEKGTERYWD